LTPRSAGSLSAARLGPATRRSDAYRGGTCTRWFDATRAGPLRYSGGFTLFRTHHRLHCSLPHAIRSAALVRIPGARELARALCRGGRARRRLGLRVHDRERGRAKGPPLLPLRGHRARALPDRGRARRGPPCDAGSGNPSTRSPRCAKAPRNRNVRQRVDPPLPPPLERGPLPHLRVSSPRVPDVLLPRSGLSVRLPDETTTRRSQRHRPPHC
jgi:hypothetical protein